MSIFSIGHSKKTIKELIVKLISHKIDVLVDVRSIPYSKYNPQFNRENVRKACEESGIKYVYRGSNLGGLKENTMWDEAIDELIKAGNGKNVCVMCSEADPNDCHRQSKIQPSVEERGGTIEHILWDKKVRMEKENGNAELVMYSLF